MSLSVIDFEISYYKAFNYQTDHPIITIYNYFFDKFCRFTIILKIFIRS